MYTQDTMIGVCKAIENYQPGMDSNRYLGALKATLARTEIRGRPLTTIDAGTLRALYDVSTNMIRAVSDLTGRLPYRPILGAAINPALDAAMYELMRLTEILLHTTRQLQTCAPDLLTPIEAKQVPNSKPTLTSAHVAKLDAYLKRQYERTGQTDRAKAPNEFGGQGITYDASPDGLRL